MTSAGISRQYLPVVLENLLWPTYRRIRQHQLKAKLGRRGPAEGVRGPWNSGTAELPDALSTNRPGRVDGVEVGARRRIHAARPWIGIGGIRDVALARRNRIELDTRHVGLKGYPAVAQRAVDEWACEQERGWVQRRVAIGPDRLVRHAVEVGVGASAPRDRDACRVGSAQAEDVVLMPGVSRIEIMHPVRGANPAAVDRIAVLPVSDL